MITRNPMQIQTTKNSKVSPVVLVYGAAGVGKTYLADPNQCESPIVVDVDKGLSSLRAFDVPFVSINTEKDLDEFIAQVKSNFGYAERLGSTTPVRGHKIRRFHWKFASRHSIFCKWNRVMAAQG